MRLYSGIYYYDLLLEINIYMPNRCYNVNCTNLDNKIASAKWSRLPITGWGGKAYITFYVDVNCGGSKSSSLLPYNGGIRGFVFPKVKGAISSFMVRSESRTRKHGFEDVCSWTGADMKGGVATEPDKGESAILNDPASCAFLVMMNNCEGARIVGKINGTVELYSGIYYNNRLLTLNIRYPNQCYNINCEFLDDNVASAKWSDLPTTGIAGKAYIVFYENADCGGYQATYTLPHFGGIRDFDVQKVKGKISAFMVKSENDLVDNGMSNVCIWAGADAVGGYVSQDKTLASMVVPKPN